MQKWRTTLKHFEVSLLDLMSILRICLFQPQRGSSCKHRVHCGYLRKAISSSWDCKSLALYVTDCATCHADFAALGGAGRTENENGGSRCAHKPNKSLALILVFKNVGICCGKYVGEHKTVLAQEHPNCRAPLFLPSILMSKEAQTGLVLLAF